MGSRGLIGDRLRERLKAERERHGISMRKLADTLTGRLSTAIYQTTISKIENGDRDVRVDELVALSEVYGISINALLGLDNSTADVAWAAGKLSSNAQRTVAEVMTLQNKLASDVNDLAQHAERDGRRESIGQLLHLGNQAFLAFEALRVRLDRLANEFPLPGVTFDEP